MVRRDARAANGLPAEVTSLVGRGAETADVRGFLARSRLVTLVGPGGVGKTRLATHVARSVRSAFPDGVWLVPLAELTRPDLVAATVLSRMSVSGSTGTDVRDVVDHIGDRQLLLVLDNCEHLAEAAASLAGELLRGCRNLKLLATSRAALRVEGEALYPVPPLAVPDPDAALASGAAATYDGIALFMERASMVSHDFAAGRIDERAVIELCQRLDGLPLAIELAAAGTRLLSVETLLNRAADPLAAPPTATRSAPGRHRSLRASLDYSHELCSAAAQALWARFSVFRGGAVLGAIEEVCSGPDLARDAIAPALFELVDKSIVEFSESRYRMLETIRQFGDERLREAGQQGVVRDRHLAHFDALSQEVQRNWFGPEQANLLARLLEDQANVRAALEFSLGDPLKVPAGLRMASALYALWIGAGLPGEGRHWLGSLLAKADVNTPDRASALWVHGFLTAVDGDIPTARALLEDALEAASGVDDASAAHAMAALGLADLFEGRIGEAIAHVEAGVAAERALEDNNAFLAEALINLGLCYCFGGDLERAIQVLEEARTLCLTHGEELLHSWALVILGLVRLLRGELEEAVVLLVDALARKRSIHNAQGMTWAVELLAWAALDSGDPERAAVLLGACEARAKDLGTLLHGSRGMVEWHDQYVQRARELLGDGRFNHSVARGRRLSMDELVAVALGEDHEASRQPESLLGDLPLTPREREIAELVAEGKTNREIAAELVIALRTVDTHVQHILTKLGFTSRSQVVALVVAGRPSSS